MRIMDWSSDVCSSDLMVLAGALAWLAQARAKTVLALSVPSAAGDLAWSAGSVMVAATVTMNGLGQVLVLAQAAAITCLAVAKLTPRRAAARRIIRALATLTPPPPQPTRPPGSPPCPYPRTTTGPPTRRARTPPQPK